MLQHTVSVTPLTVICSALTGVLILAVVFPQKLGSTSCWCRSLMTESRGAARPFGTQRTGELLCAVFDAFEAHFSLCSDFVNIRERCLDGAMPNYNYAWFAEKARDKLDRYPTTPEEDEWLLRVAAASANAANRSRAAGLFELRLTENER